MTAESSAPRARVCDIWHVIGNWKFVIYGITATVSVVSAGTIRYVSSTYCISSEINVFTNRVFRSLRECRASRLLLFSRNEAVNLRGDYWQNTQCHVDEWGCCFHYAYEWEWIVWTVLRGFLFGRERANAIKSWFVSPTAIEGLSLQHDCALRSSQDFCGQTASKWAKTLSSSGERVG